MHYTIRNKHMSTWVETQEGRVVHCAASMMWTLGKRIDEVLRWCRSKKLGVYVAAYEGGQMTRMDL